MKKILSILMLLVAIVTGAWAQTTYTYTGYNTAITNGWTHDYGDTYVGRKGSNYTPNTGGLPTGNGNIFAAFQVTSVSKIKVVFVWTKTNGDLTNKSINLASINKSTFDQLALASTATTTDVKYNISDFTSSQNMAVAINRSDANKEVEFEFDNSVGAGYYAVYTASSINSDALIKKIIVTPAGAVDPEFSLSATSIGTDETAQIKVAGKDDLDGITLSNIAYGTPGVVTVSSDGVVTPAAAGTTTITFNSSAVDGKYNAGSGNLSITVTVPKCATPTIAVGDFNFENKGYKVTITNNEAGSTLKVSTDGSSYTTQTSPYETYATATTHYYAKAEKTSYEDSDVADENVENTFDGEKKYIAWVHGTDGNYSGYNADEDPMVIALKPIYNVIPVGSDKDTAPKADLSNADLIVCTEAMTGKTTFSNGMVALLDGTAPMIGLKMFNYGDGKDATKRWAWGTPANPGSTTLGFTAKNTNYKVLDGVTFESDGTIKLATAKGTSDNVIQTVNFTGASKPADNVILGTLDDDDTKAVMHYSATKKYFGLGLSVDCRANYTANATTIVKNAAAMLIAGEDLTATVEKIEIDASGVATYVTKNALDFTGLETKAYVVKSVDTKKNKVFTEEVTKVPAGTALLVKGATVNVPVIANATAPATNLFQVSNGSVTGAAGNIFAYSKSSKQFKKVASSVTIPSGKCYLEINGVLGSLDVDFEGEATAINNVDANENANSAAPVKVIKNGKLYIGNYNVAGQLVK